MSKRAVCWNILRIHAHPVREILTGMLTAQSKQKSRFEKRSFLRRVPWSWWDCPPVHCLRREMNYSLGPWTLFHIPFFCLCYVLLNAFIPLKDSAMSLMAHPKYAEAQRWIFAHGPHSIPRRQCHHEVHAANPSLSLCLQRPSSHVWRLTGRV